MIQITRESLTVDLVRKLLRKGALTSLKNILQKVHPADIALFFNYLNEKEKEAIFRLCVEIEKFPEIISLLESSESAKLLTTLKKEEIYKIFKNIHSDDVVDIINALPEELAQDILSFMKKEDVAEIESLLEYKEDTAGGIMNPDFFALEENTTVKDAVDSLRNSKDVEMVFYLYVVDNRNHLVGVVSLRYLVTSKSDAKLKDIMNTDVISVRTNMDQEEVARIVTRYDILAVPVVDEENKLVGVIMVDDIIDVIRAENTEDMMKMAGITEEEIVTKSTYSSFKIRLPWLFATFIGGIFASEIIGVFQENLKQVIALAFFIPIIMGMGGNIGTQTSAIVVRGIALGKVDVKQFWHFIFKQLKIGILLGITYGILLGVVARFLHAEVSYIGITVCLAIISQMAVASILGSMIPMILKKLNIDPAVATAPFVSTALDIIGIITYFTFASIFIFKGI